MLPPCIAITIGDPVGISPKIMLNEVLHLRDRLDFRSLESVAVGCAKTYLTTATALGVAQPISDFCKRGSACDGASLYFIDVDSLQTDGQVKQ